VLGGGNSEEAALARVALATVEVLKAGELTFTALPSLSCGPRACSIALPIDESESAEGQVLLMGGSGASSGSPPVDIASRVVTVDLATGACNPHPALLYDRVRFAAARLPDGRVVCAGGEDDADDIDIDSDIDDSDSDSDIEDLAASITAEVLEPPEQGSPDDAVWLWRELPHMSVRRFGPAGCILSDGRFAVFGGWSGGESMASCEALTLDGDERWEPLPPMRETRCYFVCVAVGGCVIVAGGTGSTTAVEVYEEALGRWRRLPCNLPHEGHLHCLGSALL
jgi:hypothetical protein